MQTLVCTESTFFSYTQVFDEGSRLSNMSIGTVWKWFWSRETLLSGWLLVTLSVGVGLGTIYGYMWYWNQILYTLHYQSPWLVPFVPDSPTASLFFTFSIIYLEWDRRKGRLSPEIMQRSRIGFVRGFVEAFTLVTMVKYGIWAVVIIYWAYVLGEPYVWEHGMLTVSHLAMALAACVYAVYFRFRVVHLAWVALWTILNDVMDYRFSVFPWLSEHLLPYLSAVQWYTHGMSMFSILLAAVYLYRRNRQSNK